MTASGPRRAEGPGQRAGVHLRQDLAQPCLGGALREVAVRRAAATRPRGPDPLLHLTTVGQPVLRVPDGPSTALPAEDVAGDRRDLIELEHRAGPRDKLGTKFAR